MNQNVELSLSGFNLLPFSIIQFLTPLKQYFILIIKPWLVHFTHSDFTCLSSPWSLKSLPLCSLFLYHSGLAKLKSSPISLLLEYPKCLWKLRELYRLGSVYVIKIGYSFMIIESSYTVHSNYSKFLLFKIPILLPIPYCQLISSFPTYFKEYNPYDVNSLNYLKFNQNLSTIILPSFFDIIAKNDMSLPTAKATSNAIPLQAFW